jgi:prepilin-type N-terminal cleavage/methylation domain-containing protein/prepilin-type processing-associated H-X9-DG protein
MMRQRRSRVGFTLVELLVVIAIIGVLVALLLPAVQAAREAARRTECSNKLKQLALAMHLYHDANKTFPPGAQMSSTSIGGASYFAGWTREIMPFVENSQLRDLYVPDVPVSHPRDERAKQFRETSVGLYNCPSDFPPELAIPGSGPHNNQEFRTSSYRANAGRGDGFVTWYLYEDVGLESSPPDPQTGRHWGWRGPVHTEISRGSPQPTDRGVLRRESFKNIVDGTSHTLLLGESTNEFNRRRSFWAWTWGNYLMSQPSAQERTFDHNYPNCPNDTGTTGAYPGRSRRTCMSAWWAWHAGGMNAAMCDGSVGFVLFDIDLNLFASRGSIDGADDESTAWVPSGGRR